MSVDKHYLEVLSYRFPTISKASTEIINLSAILQLPKATEHFISDIHGEYEQFDHIIRNGSGAVKNKIEEEFGFELSPTDKRELATLIYYPEQKMQLVENTGINMHDWYRTALFRLLRMIKRSSMKYSRSKVRKTIDPDFVYIIDEMLAENETDAETKAELKKLAEKVRFSDPMSHEMLSELESRISAKVEEMKTATDKKGLVAEVTTLLTERNKKCKILK